MSPLISCRLQVFIILRHQVLENADGSGSNIFEYFTPVRCGSGSCGGCTANDTRCCRKSSLMHKAYPEKKKVANGAERASGCPKDSGSLLISANAITHQAMDQPNLCRCPSLAGFVSLHQRRPPPAQRPLQRCGQGGSTLVSQGFQLHRKREQPALAACLHDMHLHLAGAAAPRQSRPIEIIL